MASWSSETEEVAPPFETAVSPGAEVGVAALMISESSSWSLFPFLEDLKLDTLLSCPVDPRNLTAFLHSIFSLPFSPCWHDSANIIPSLFLASAEMAD